MADPAPEAVTIRARRRAAAIERMADHVLEAGLAGASLRPLAKAAGTSDRMLLYYFASKDEILAETLGRIAARLSDRLAEALPDPAPGAARLPPDRLLAQLATVLGTPALQPYMRVWLELAAASARGQEPHRSIAGAIADGFLAWIAARLPPAGAPGDAARLLALIEGLALLDALGRPQMVALALANDGKSG
jgi:AcrR family transcriptional regulator